MGYGLLAAWTGRLKVVLVVVLVAKEACGKGHKREAALRPRNAKGTRSKGHERRVNVGVVWCGKEGKERK